VIFIYGAADFMNWFHLCFEVPKSEGIKLVYNMNPLSL